MPPRKGNVGNKNVSKAQFSTQCDAWWPICALNQTCFTSYSTPSLILSGSINVALPNDEELDLKVFYEDQEAIHFDANSINRIISGMGNNLLLKILFKIL